MKRLLFGSFVALALAVSAVQGQTTLSTTTLAAAVANTSTTTVRVASATGITAGTTSLWVDHELMTVTGVSGTTISVIRGAGSTRPTPHKNGVTVYVAPTVAYQSYTPAGACTRSSLTYLPWIDVSTGNMCTCDARSGAAQAWTCANTFPIAYNSTIDVGVP